jgi:hypothetical protein
MQVKRASEGWELSLQPSLGWCASQTLAAADVILLVLESSMPGVTIHSFRQHSWWLWLWAAPLSSKSLMLYSDIPPWVNGHENPKF